MPKYAGKATIKVDGLVLNSQPGASCDLGGTKRNPVVTDQGMGYTEEEAPSEVSCEVVLSAGVSLDGLRNLTNATILFETDTAQRFIIKGGYATNPPKVSKGTVSLTFNGEPAQEMVS